MRYFHKKMNMICFESEDLRSLFEASGRLRLLKEVNQSGYSIDELIESPTKREEISSKFRIIQDKEDLEIFHALYLYLDFYPKAKICFVLKDSVNPATINSLTTLKASIKESSLADFVIMTDEGTRAFQLKAYTGRVELGDFFEFIKNKLAHYGNDIGDVNLLVPLRSTGVIQDSFFQNIHERLKALGIRGTGHILISYNEEGKFSVINTVHPVLATTSLPFNRARA